MSPEAAAWVYLGAAIGAGALLALRGDAPWPVRLLWFQVGVAGATVATLCGLLCAIGR